METWEYTLDDYLEMACAMDQKSRDSLIQELKQKGVFGTTVKVCPAFLIGKHLIFVPGTTYPVRKGQV